MPQLSRMTLTSQAPPSTSPGDAVHHGWFAALPPTIRPWLQLMRLDRPIGGWLLYWPCVFGLVLGSIADERNFTDWRDFYYVALFGLGTVVMRGAGCTFNDIIDRDFDAQVARTRARPIPAGLVSVKQAVLFMIVLCLIGLVILLQLNWLAVALGAGSLLLVAAYPFMKRITWWPQAWLGLTFNWGALLGFAAETGRLDIADGLLYAGLFFWTLGYDTIYAHQDKEDDALIGVKSTARLLGADSRKWILRFYAVAFTLILAAGFADHAGWNFGVVMLAPGGHLLWQVKRLNIDNAENCLMLFRANRETGALIAAAFALAAWLA
jgi:4-hydroxybenzoate polyprenyltransferase